MTPRALAIGIGAALASAAPAAAAQPLEAPVRLVLEEPQPGARVSNQLHQAQVRGHAAASAGTPLAYDVLLVLDASGSTEEPAGSDIDGDGETGFNPRNELLEPGAYPETLRNTDPGDSILAAEVAAARTLLATLDPARVRVGVVSFSGEMDPMTGRRLRFDQQDAWVEAPLTHDFDAVRAQLDAILARGPFGGTNFAAGLRLAVTELSGLPGARSQPRAGAARVVLFLTDGVPTFPIDSGATTEPGDVEVAVTAARLARKAGVRVNTYALGPKALTEPLAATEIARLTLGTYLPVRSPGDIVSFLQAVSFANIEDVVVSNLTTGELSTDVALRPDGHFEGFVPVREGENRLRVTALASDGSRSTSDLTIQFELAGLTGRELGLELERIRNRNKELELLLERGRIQSFRAHQKKELELRVEPPGAEAGEPGAPADESGRSN